MSGVDSRVLVRSGAQTESVRVFRQNKKVIEPRKLSLSERAAAKRDRLAQEFWLSSPKPPAPDPVKMEQERRRAFVASRPKGLDWCSYPESGIDITESEEYRWADIIHLHWVADFLDWESFFSKNTKPLVWTLHDQNPFLGVQHYAERYLGMDAQGYPLPRILTLEEKEEEEKVLVMKQRALENVGDMRIVSPSRWLHEEVKASKLLGRFAHHHIPNHFPGEVFKPLDRAFCRRVLNLPQDATIVLFVADNLGVTRKGLPFLYEASSSLRQQALFCAAGASTGDMMEGLHGLGHIRDERLMAVAYSAADVFVIPSLEDNLPNTMIESILCGTPVIGFPTGGIMDAIGEQFDNGYICDEISVAALKQALVKFLESPDVFDRGRIASEGAAKYAGDAVISRYLELYRSVFENQH